MGKVNINFITGCLTELVGELQSPEREIAEQSLYDAIEQLKKNNFKKSYDAALQIYQLAGKLIDDLNQLYHSVLFAEDVVTANSLVFIHQDSPYYKSIKEISMALGFDIRSHHLSESYWTKDYLVSTGEEVIAPIKKDSGYMTPFFMEQAKLNTRLYYQPLQMNEHHHSKLNLKSSTEWNDRAIDVLNETTLVHKTMLEGGNFFCAINPLGERFYLIGENVLSDTMAFNKVSREEAIQLITEELCCPQKKLLFIPQWTYHLDLQMAYLGKGQFILHSFEQPEIDFGLDKEEKIKANATFSFLKEQFEARVINTTYQILEEHGFIVKKVFGCLFYLDDCSNVEQLKYVPYCKKSDGFDGVLALMMNGIAADLGEKGRHFMVLRCDLNEFRMQFEQSLSSLGMSQVHQVDLLDAYDWSGNFEGMLMGIFGAHNVTQIAATMNGSLRCQTSIVSKNLTLDNNLRHRFFTSDENTPCEEISVQSGLRFRHGSN